MSPVRLARIAQAGRRQLEFYAAKLAYEVDSWDLAELLKDVSVVVVDTRSQEAC